MSTGLKNALSSYARATKKVREVVDAVVDEQSCVELNAFMGGANSENTREKAFTAGLRR